ncbi:MAG: hypothetical protein Alis3KO_06730 [Aliiglaciecola sp.]|uniref:hypothetical protein n=1 Tax=Aliiglaciecola sp. M165 TaxID=2593649 RepID=UPI00118137B3|nr:hypothetical protein [Aliiglaciecola sp. M165]TRY29282.1 hypothetical protein FM019_17910 [Aliiglaciecola sp. M165]
MMIWLTISIFAVMFTTLLAKIKGISFAQLVMSWTVNTICYLGVFTFVTLTFTQALKKELLH